MKKFLAIILTLIVCFSVLAACGQTYDDTELLNRIKQLEQELDQAKSSEGIKGDKGETGIQGPQGETGEQGIGSGCNQLHYNSSDTAIFLYKRN